MPVDQPSEAAIDAVITRLVALRPAPGAIRVPAIADLPEVHGRVWRPVPGSVRIAAGAATVGAVAAGVALLASTLPADSPGRTGPEEAALATGANGGVVPIVSVQAEVATTELTLADGSVLSLSFPAGNDLAAEGFLPQPSLAWPVRGPDPDSGDTCCGRDLFVLHTPRDELLADHVPTATYPGSGNESVLYFDELPSIGRAQLEVGGYLVYAFEDWTAVVWTGPPSSDPASAVGTMTEDERRTWAAAVGGETDENGYLVLSPQAPLSWAAVSYPDGKFGDDGPLTLGIYVGPCDPEPAVAETTTSVCFPDEDVEVRLTNRALPRFGDLELLEVDVLEEGPLFDLAG